MAGNAKTLNPRQLAFALAVVAGSTYTDAARTAGYGANATGSALTAIASRVASRPLVQEAIAHERARAAASQQMTAEWWRKELATVYTQCQEAADRPSALRALELAGRHLGLLDTKQDSGAAELAARLMANLAASMAVQASQTQVALPATVEGQVRATMARGE